MKGIYPRISQLMGFLCARLCITGTRFLRPPANQKFIWKRIERFFLKLYLIIHTLNSTYRAKKIWRPMNPCKFSKANFFKKWTFFKNFGIFGISSMSWLEKWSCFLILKNFEIWPFWHWRPKTQRWHMKQLMFLGVPGYLNMDFFAIWNQIMSYFTLTPTDLNTVSGK